MYHPTVIQHAIESYEAKHKTKLHRYSVGEVDERMERMPKADAKGKLSRELKPAERAFIANEQAMTTFDFLYWAERYGYFVADPEAGEAGLQRFTPWESQQLSLNLTAKVQLEQWERKKRGETVEGIRRVDHKGGRQLGGTQLASFQVVHRMTRLKYQRCVAASSDDDKVAELYDRHHVIYDHLPFYLKPKKKYDNRGSGQWELVETRSPMLYQNATQRGGLAQGRSRDVAQFTEMASWDSVAGWDITRVQFELQFLPTAPRSLWTLLLIESTSLVRGDWWHDFVDRVRRGRMPGWFLNFIPYYAESKRYRRTPPPNWRPNEESKKHAKMVWDTSPEFMGKHVMLEPDQLYWYESEYNAKREGRALNLFLCNFACTPEQSFQHAGQGMFETEFLDSLRKDARVPMTFDAVMEQSNA